ncbi:MAG: hypothetical protein ACLQPD_34185, partial [Desulfomonilaceae bacterium]
PNSLEAPPLEEGELRPEASLKPMFHSNSLTTATKKPLALHCCNAGFKLDLSDNEEDNGGKRAASVVSRFPEAPLPAGPRGPLQTSRTR